MDVFANLWLGLQTALSLANLFYCFVGVFLGTAIGITHPLTGTCFWCKISRLRQY